MSKFWARLRRCPWWLGSLLVLALLGGVLYATRAQVLPLAAHFLDVGEPPQPVDYVLVLNGDPETRPFVAAALVKAGLARQVLVTTAMSLPETEDGTRPHEQEITHRILRLRGVPEEGITVLPGEISSTFDEARVLAAFLRDRPDSTVAVVTNGFHTRRARWIFRRQLPENGDRLHFISAPRDGVDESTWWQTENGVGVYLGEYSKCAWYWLRY